MHNHFPHKSGEGNGKWQTTLVLLPWEPHEQYEKAKRCDNEQWTPWASRCPICYWKRVEKHFQKEWRGRSKARQGSVVDVTGDGSKVWCCKEQYFIGTWNVRSMSQGKWEVVKQNMARVNINNLGISELRGTGLGGFNSDDRYIYYCGQKSLRWYGVALIVNRRFRNAVFGCSLKNHRMISACFQGKPFNITVIQVSAPTSNA